MSKWNEMSSVERDAWIGEHIMGLRVEHWTPETYKDSDPAYNYVTGYVVINGEGHIPYWSPLSRYTQDWNAAWQVLQRMVQEHCVWTLDGYSEVWCRFTYELNQVHPLEPNIYPWIALWTPEILAKSAYYGVTGEQV